LFSSGNRSGFHPRQPGSIHQVITPTLDANSAILMQLDPHLAAIIQHLADQAIALEQFQVDGFVPTITMLYQPSSAMLEKPLSK